MPRLIRLLGPLAALALAGCGAVTAEPTQETRRQTPAPAATFTFEPPTTSPTRTPSPSPTPTPSPTPSPTPTRTPTPTPTPIRTPAATATATAPAARTATPSATPAPRPEQALQGTAFIIGDGVAVRSAPSTKDGAVVARLGNLQQIELLGAVKGERWVVGEQTWAMAYQAWTDTWYRVEGGYIYSGFVFIPRAGEGDPLARTGPRRIEVDLASQTLRAFVGDQVVFTTGVTTGKAGYETPQGKYTVGAWGRVANETMTSSQAGITDPAEAYNVKNVLYTQYFDGAGDALHLNYWQPDSVFGAVRTSHGCVGLQLHEAQWLWLFASGGVPLEVR